MSLSKARQITRNQTCFFIMIYLFLDFLWYFEYIEQPIDKLCSPLSKFTSFDYDASMRVTGKWAFNSSGPAS